MRSLLAMILAIAAATAVAEVTQIEGTLTALDAAKRTLAIDGKTYEIAKKCDVSIKGQPGKLEDIPKDESVVVSYDEKFEMISAIAAGQSTWLFYDFMCHGVTPQKGCQIIDGKEIRCLPLSAHNSGRFMLVTSKQYENYVFRCEFLYEDEIMDGNPFVGIASTVPTMNGKTPRERFPQGIEVKLWHRGLGSLCFWDDNFKAEMVYGQAREGRVVPPLKQQSPTRRGWNTLEIESKKDKTILIKGNGVLLNAIGDAEKTKGHIVLFPPIGEFRFRDVTIEADGVKTPLLFSDMTPVACDPIAP